MDQIMLGERALLYTLAFELQVEHPFNTIVKALKRLGMVLPGESKDSKESAGTILSQAAVNFANDRCILSVRNV